MYVCLEYYTKFYTIHRFYIYVRISYNILYGIKYMITYQNFVWRSWWCFCTSKSSNSFKFSQIVFGPLQNLFWCLLNVNFCHQQLCKATLLTYDLGSIWNFGETWKVMFNTIFQNFESFNFRKWEILLLPWNHLKLRPEHKMTYNSLSTTLNSLRFGRCIKYFFSISIQNFSSIDDNHKKLSL